MIRFLAISALAITIFACTPKSEFNDGSIVIELDIENANDLNAVLEMLPPGPKRIQLDTVSIDANGRAIFLANATKPAFYSVYVPGKEGELRFTASPGDSVKLSADANAIYASGKIGGSKENQRLDSLITYIKATKYYTDSLNKIFQAAQAKNLHFALMEEFQQLYSTAKIKEEKYVLKYILKNPTQFSNLIAVQSLNKDRNKEVYLMVDSNLMATYPNSDDVLKFNSIIKQMYSQVIGQKAPNFNLLDINNKPVSLSDFEGKYVLLDFWATWCRPCIAEIPTLKKIKKELGSDNFEIVSICIDRNNDGSISTWKTINDKYETNWVQLYDADGMATAKNYNIKQFPTLLIVGPDGNILDAGEHIRGENTLTLLKKFMGNE